ncbi:MAG: hypothetical protein Q9214_004870, partial [Letrouitia sp. 1 TL-2023]
MVAISVVRKANGTLASKPTGLICVFVGATRGIGASTLSESAKHLKSPKIYVLGRSKAKCTRQLAELGTLNPSASIVFLEAEVARLRSVDEACDHIKSLESSLDLLYMSPGVLAMGGPDCLDKCFALSYYSRMRFIHNLLPLLNQSPAPRVVSVLAGGQERRLITDDLGLKHHFSLLNVIDQTTTMHTLALEHIAKTNPSISFLHVYPGWVQTDIMENFFNSKHRLSSTLYQILSVLA